MPPVVETEDVTVRDAQFQSESLGRAMKYRIILPAGYDRQSQRYPVLYLLHGLGQARELADQGVEVLRRGDYGPDPPLGRYGHVVETDQVRGVGRMASPS